MAANAQLLILKQLARDLAHACWLLAALSDRYSTVKMLSDSLFNLFNFLSYSGQRVHRNLPNCTGVVSHLRLMTPITAFAGSLTLWVCFVRVLRWKRYNALHRKYGPKWKGGLGTISAQEAQEITQLGVLYDMPWLIHQAVAFALFKTYAIVRLKNHGALMNDV